MKAPKTTKPPQTTPLPERFVKSDWNHQLVQREGDIAIYRRWKNGGLPPHWEVFRVTLNKERELGGKILPESEHYPSANDFGRIAWTYPSLTQAREKLQELKRRAK